MNKYINITVECFGYADGSCAWEKYEAKNMREARKIGRAHYEHTHHNVKIVTMEFEVISKESFE